MRKHDFRSLYDRYPAAINRMPEIFTSHQFILTLAQENQRLYIEALYSYRMREAPFKVVHGILAAYLRHVSKLVRRLGNADVASPNVFGEHGSCALWQRVGTH